MAVPFQFAHSIEFSPETAAHVLRRVPATRGVFALRGHAAEDGKQPEPYLTRAADMRRRISRLLAPPEAVDDSGQPVLSRRLNLRSRVRSIEWTPTGSDFESSLVLYSAALEAFGAEQARRRLRLHTPYMVRVTRQHVHPRAYVTNRISRRSLAESFGPFPSRAAAERYCDAVLDLFQLRRCHEDLDVRADHPGCVYGEMNKCLQPCKAAVDAAGYGAETTRVFDFFRTRGESLLAEVAHAREAASENMDFEQAATLHKQWEKVKAAASFADEVVRPITALRALIVQQYARERETLEGASVEEPQDAMSGKETAAIFLFERGRILGPEPLSTLGVRAVREQTAVGSSLFAQPLMLAPVPLDTVPSISTTPGAPSSASPGDSTAEAKVGLPGSDTTPLLPTSLSPEGRARATLAALEAQATDADLAELCDSLSLFRRWYYRPEKQRSGEVFFPNADGGWPIRRLLNGAARVVLGPPAALPSVDREAAREITKAARTKVLHAGREGVERTVPVLNKPSRSTSK